MLQSGSNMIKEKTVKELLGDLQKVVYALQARSPKEAPLFFSKSIDPLRGLHLREACFHRIAELAESTYEAFKKENLATGYLLAQAIVETMALFWHFLDEVRDALKNEDSEHLREILTRILVGTKAEKTKDDAEAGWEEVEEVMEKPLGLVHPIDLIKHISKAYPPFLDIYDYLCEVSHPGVDGLIKAYTRNDWEARMVFFGKGQGKFGSHLQSDLEALMLMLAHFMDLYDESERLLEKFMRLCEVKA